MVRKYSKWQLPKSFILNYGAYQIFRQVYAGFCTFLQVLQVFATWSFLQHADFLQLAAFFVFAAFCSLQFFAAFCSFLQVFAAFRFFAAFHII